MKRTKKPQNSLELGKQENTQAIALSDDITPKQFAKAEPLVLTMILEDPQCGYRYGIVPLTEDDLKTNRVRREKPGEYVGEFRDKKDPKKGFAFHLRVENAQPVLTYSPINPELFKEENPDANQK